MIGTSVWERAIADLEHLLVVNREGEAAQSEMAAVAIWKQRRVVLEGLLKSYQDGTWVRASYLFQGTIYTEKQLYDICGAIRGPDSAVAYSLLKRVIGARVRHILFPNGQVSQHAEYTSRPLIAYDLQELKDWMVQHPSGSEPALAHLKQHYYNAVSATTDHPVWGGLGSQLRLILSR